MARVPLSADAVLALSPDAASSKAAQGLLAPGKWPMLGADDMAVWGECQGSGSKPYQTQVDVSGAGPTFRCSCPSRKFPCKHGLALLLLQAQTPQSFSAAQPAWVSEWLASRQQRAEKKEAKALEAPVAVDPAAAAKREAQRWQRMANGAQELALWLDDTCNKGLANLSKSDAASWTTLAARMVDAQAPGLAQRVTHALAVVGEGRDWPARLLSRLGRLQLLVDAVPQSERLTPCLQADLRQALGWTIEREDVLAQGERLVDHWRVLAQVSVERETRLTERRVWLHGEASQRRALLVDYSYAGKAFEQGWSTGTTIQGALAFYPSADPLRAVWAETQAAAQAATPPQVPTSENEWHALAKRIAANPWAPSWPLWLKDAQLQHTPDAEATWWLWQEGRAIPIAIREADAWQWLALSGGKPFAVFGEWTGEALEPMTAWCDSECWTATGMQGQTT